MSTHCYCLGQRPSLSLTSISRVRVSKRPGSLLSLNRSLRCIECSPRAWKKKWRVWCFVPQESSSGINGADFSENKLPEELDKLELEQSSAENSHHITSLSKAADAVLGIPDEPWTVPWTAETILQVKCSNVMTNVSSHLGLSTGRVEFLLGPIIFCTKS
eukprot:TRINITY_DN1992_c0_g1_i3.p1 TRINITY_DN1992_c0_g1~~TRINITY_DN1992_c0_g1_i3.p1  ORF type:complete len:160 (-),score=7.42 TRINITY_DN1992_c0_g1_i3:35-514(-)